jgi:hypothetical protein
MAKHEEPVNAEPVRPIPDGSPGAMIEKIRATAASATIVFVTYPREVPAGINCPALDFTNSTAAVVRSMGQILKNAFVQVVKPWA